MACTGLLVVLLAPLAEGLGWHAPWIYRPEMLLRLLLYAPLWETAIAQALPIELVLRLSGRRWLAAALSCAVFLGMHLPGVPRVFLAMALRVPAAAILAWTYLRFRGHGAQAYLVTAATHSGMNGAVILSLLFLR